jgi:hypothetical protein
MNPEAEAAFTCVMETIQKYGLQAEVLRILGRHEDDEVIETCSGCLTQQPNQLCHMEPGGCLYTPPEEDDPDE